MLGVDYPPFRRKLKLKYSIDIGKHSPLVQYSWYSIRRLRCLQATFIQSGYLRVVKHS